MLIPKPIQAGDWVIYRKTKFSKLPGPRAHGVAPTPHGDEYVYVVDKFWVVQDVLNDGRLKLRTRRGKEHVVAADDPNLRIAGWWDRFRHRTRFEAILAGGDYEPDESEREDQDENQGLT